MPLEQKFVVFLGPEQGSVLVRKLHHDADHIASLETSPHHSRASNGGEIDSEVTLKVRSKAFEIPSFVGAAVFSQRRTGDAARALYHHVT
jgi:hypothetical protein